MTHEWERDAAQFEESRPTAPCGAAGCDCGYTIEKLNKEKEKLREACRKALQVLRNPDYCSNAPEVNDAIEAVRTARRETRGILGPTEF